MKKATSIAKYKYLINKRIYSKKSFRRDKKAQVGKLAKSSYCID